MKAYGGVGSEWSASSPGRFTPRERAPGTHWIRGWVGPRTGLDDGEKRKFLTPPELELRPLCRSARSQSLYRLSYPGSRNDSNKYKIILIKMLIREMYATIQFKIFCLPVFYLKI
jgi:hypothetical protein